MTVWHAVCHDCDEFEKTGPGAEIAIDAHEHERDTGHSVSGMKVDE